MIAAYLHVLKPPSTHAIQLYGQTEQWAEHIIAPSILISTTIFAIARVEEYRLDTLPHCRQLFHRARIDRIEVRRFDDLVAHFGVVLNYMLHGCQRSMNAGDQPCAPYPQAVGNKMLIDAHNEIVAEVFDVWRRRFSQPVEAFDQHWR